MDGVKLNINRMVIKLKKICKCEVCNQTLFFYDDDKDVIEVKCKRCKTIRNGDIEKIKKANGIVKF
jgi:phage FluMu protein Com